eukprot:gene14267-19143_t
MERGEFDKVSFTGIKDLVKLKLQRKLILESLNQTDNKLNRLGEVIHKKKDLGNSSLNLNPQRQTLTMHGKAVDDFLIPPRSIKAIPTVKVYDPYATQPQPVSNENILRIRHQYHINHTAADTIKSKQLLKKIDADKKIKPAKVIPSINVPPSMLPNRYIRGELPCTIEHGKGGTYLSWACPLENLDYEFYLPLFFDGLQVKEYPVSYIARQGIEDMLFASRGFPERIIPVVPLLAKPLRNALAKFDDEILLAVLKSLQQLILCNEGVGETLMPYGKQFLGPISFFMDRNKNIGDAMDFAQRKRDDIGEEIRKVLELMEEHGGVKALKYIKFSIPLYESCMKRPDAHHLKS